LCIYYVWKWK